MSDEAVTKQIEGVCEEISEKSGWTQFSIDVGSQYPIRISTKLPALIEQLRAVGQQRAVWTFKESQGKENPNRPGTFFTNRYAEGVEVGGTVLPPQSEASPGGRPPSSAPTHAPLPPGDKDRAITRMAVLKAAAEVVAAQIDPGVDWTPEFDPGATTIELAARFETWVYRDVDDLPF